MADTNKAIGILFEVAGQGEISGESGRLIQQQLKQITERVNLQLKLNINKTHFREQLTQLKSEMEQMFGTALFSTDTSSKNLPGAQPKSAEYTELIRLANEYKSAIRVANAETVKGTAIEAERSDIATAALDKLTKKADEYRAASKISPDQHAYIQRLIEDYKGLGEAVSRITTAKTTDSMVALNLSSQKLFAKGTSLKERYSDLLHNNEKAQASYKKLENAALSFQTSLDSGNYSEAIAAQKEYISQLAVTQSELSKMAFQSDGLKGKISETFTSKLIQKFAYALIALAGNAMRKVYKTVVDIDTAMGQLRIVTGATTEEYKNFSKVVVNSAKEIGSSVTDLIDSTTVYARLGYSLEDAAILAEKTTMYSKVGAVEIGEATSNITAIIKAFGIAAQDLEGVIDQLIYVGNSYAISSAELGEGMNNAASALAANGNTLLEAMGILTAAQVTLQNASKSSTAVRTIAARIAQSKVELEELGESTDSVLATAALDEKMRAFGVAVTDANGNLRSTYDILSDLSKIWDNLNNTQRAAIANMLAGTRQQNAFYSIMQNWQDAENIVNNAADGYGALGKAQSVYLDTIEGKLQQLKASWEELASTLLDSEFVKSGVEFLTKVVNGLDNLVESVSMTSVVLTTILGLIALLAPKIVVFFNTLKEQVGSTKALIEGGILGTILTIITILNSLDDTVAKVFALILSLIGAFCASLFVYLRAVDAAINSTGIGAVISMIAMAIAFLVSLISTAISLAKDGYQKQKKLKEETEKTAKALQEQADALKEVSDAMKDACDSIDSLISKYTELGNAATAVDWNDTIMGLGAEAKKLFPEETLSELEAINKLLGTQYKYTDLIRMSMLERSNLMSEIADKSKAQSVEGAKATYEAQKNASAKSGEASGIFSITRQDWKDAGYGLVRYNELVVEAHKILKDGGVASTKKDANSQIDFTINTGSVQGNIDAIKKAMKAYEDEYANHLKDLDENPVYLALQTALTSSESEINKLTSSANDVLTSVIASSKSQIVIDRNAKDIKEEYDRVVSRFVELAKNDTTIKEMIANGLISEDISEYIGSYLAKTETEFFNKANGIIEMVNAELKTTVEILDDVSTGYDTLTSAMEDMSKTGMLTADTLKKLSDAKMLTEDFVDFATYKLKDNALTTYLGKQVDSYVNTINKAREVYEQLLKEYNSKADGEHSIEEYKKVLTAEEQLNNAMENAKTLMITLGIMERESLIEDYTDLLEKQQDALEEQIDKQKELADIRKDILSTYQEQLNYQKELEKKQRKVSMLRAQLAVASLDTSAAGQARVRTISADLTTAQDELDDYTLENAIDSIQNAIDSEVDEYESFIQYQLDQVKATIENAAQLSNDELKDSIANLGGEIKTSLPEAIVNAYNAALNGGAAAKGTATTPDKDSSTTSETKKEIKPTTATVGDATINSTKGVSNSAGNYVRLTYDGKTYDVRYGAYAGTKAWNYLSKTAERDGRPRMPVGGLAIYDGELYFRSDGDHIWRLMNVKGSTNYRDGDKDVLYNLINTLDNQRTYHKGGFVGDKVTVKNNEEYAKLLKGEFVATPQQMQNFMSKTLPSLIGYANQAKSLSIDSPLIKIECGTVDKNTLPELSELVDKAAQKVVKEMTNALNRSGYKKQY